MIETKQLHVNFDFDFFKINSNYLLLTIIDKEEIILNSRMSKLVKSKWKNED